MRVSGKRLFDKGRQILLRGFSLWDSDIIHDVFMPVTLERMQQIKNWGFNAIQIYFWWGMIEQDEGQPGVYNEERLQLIDNTIQLAAQAGLYVILTMRFSPSYGATWAGWPTTDKFEADPSARQRFYDFWAMLIQRFDSHPNLIGYNWWLFPWHESPWGHRVPEEVDLYYNTAVPNLLSVTRLNTDKIIFFTPYKQASIYVNESLLDTGEYAYISPIADDNVVYCHGWHQPYGVEWVEDIEYDAYGNRIPWDYDANKLIQQLQPGIDFMNLHNVPMMVTEMGAHTYPYPDVIAGTFYQDRLDCYDAKLALLDQYGWHWVYWMYSNQPDTQSGILKEGTFDPFAIVDVLAKHTPTPISPLGWLLPLALIAGVLYLLGRKSKRRG